MNESRWNRSTPPTTLYRDCNLNYLLSPSSSLFRKGVRRRCRCDIHSKSQYQDGYLDADADAPRDGDDDHDNWFDDLDDDSSEDEDPSGDSEVDEESDVE